MRIVITGSSTGIGHALAERLAAAGHKVCGLARSHQTAPFATALCDVADWSQVEAASRQVADLWPQGIDALVTCAGIQGEVGRTVAADPKSWDETVRVNLLGTFHAIRAFHPSFAAGVRAKIVCFSGGGATKARPRFSAYGVAKTGVVRLVETIAEEEKGAPLDINAVAPGAINTRLTDEVIAKGPAVAGQAEYDSAVKQKATGGASLDRALALVEWLISPASDGISGRLFSAPWDPWDNLGALRQELAPGKGELYTLRRVTPPPAEKRGN